MNRKKAIDYKEEYQSLNRNLARLSNEASDRLLDLAKTFPDVPIGRSDGDDITTKAIVNQKEYVNDLPLHTIIHYIEVIETYTKSLENVQQTIIKF